MPNSHEVLLTDITEMIAESETYSDITAKDVIDRIEKEIVSLQKIHKDSTEPMSPYQKGIFNGIEVVRSALTGNEPKYL